MIAANGVTARYLSASGFPSIRRVVRTPKRWDRIVEVAGEYKFKLPEVPNSRALEEFLVKQKAADPVRFPDLSLVVIKFWALANILLSFLKEMPQATLDLLSKIMLIQRLQIAAIPIC